jgi:tetratricopeptide (TPR) repeat protein
MLRATLTRGSKVLVLQGLIRIWLSGLCVFVIFPQGITAQTAAGYRQRATEMSRAKAWDDAIANYHSALALEPNDSVTHYDLALVLKYKGDTRESLKEFETAVALRPKWADAHYGLGSVWYDLQDQTSALKELHTAELSILQALMRIACWAAFIRSRTIFLRPSVN